MAKFRKASPEAAYEIAEGVNNADDAASQGLIAVESDAFGLPVAFGRYKAPKASKALPAGSEA